MTRVLSVLVPLVAACSMSQEFVADGAVDEGVDAGLELGARDAGGHDAGIPVPPWGVVVCGGTTCATGQSCCYGTLTCVDAAADCPVPAGSPPGTCLSNADCAATDYCDVGPARDVPLRCGGPGTCVSRGFECTSSLGVVCGCDGRTYPSACDASNQGVRTIAQVACGDRVGAATHTTFECDAAHTDCMAGWHCDLGVMQCLPDVALIACGDDATCGAGSTCCFALGVCLDAAHADLCRLPPTDSQFPCRSQADCDLLSNPRGATYYCIIGDGCDGFGGCAQQVSCTTGVLDPVCGCDGTSYTSACYARTAGTRVAHAGMCP